MGLPGVIYQETGTTRQKKSARQECEAIRHHSRGSITR
jgi:hypothetical protein